MKRAFLALLVIPLSFVGLLMGGWLGTIVPVGFVYLMWKLAASFPKLLNESFLKSQLNQLGFTN